MTECCGTYAYHYERIPKTERDEHGRYAVNVTDGGKIIDHWWCGCKECPSYHRAKRYESGRKCENYKPRYKVSSVGIAEDVTNWIVNCRKESQRRVRR